MVILQLPIQERTVKQWVIELNYFLLSALVSTRYGLRIKIPTIKNGINDHSTIIEMIKGACGLTVSHTIPPKKGPTIIPIDSRKVLILK